METQKAIILTPANKEDLDKWLRQGWVVKQCCGMPSSLVGGSHNSIYPTCLVIIEKV